VLAQVLVQVPFPVEPLAGEADAQVGKGEVINHKWLTGPRHPTKPMIRHSATVPNQYGILS